MLNNLLGVIPRKPFICTIGAKCAVGKTTLKVIFAGEELKKGTNVLYLTADDDVQIISSKFDKYLNNTTTDGNLKIINIYLAKKLYNFVNQELAINNYGLVIIDGAQFFVKDEISSLMVLLRSRNISVIISTNLSNKLSMVVPVWSELVPQFLLYMSDYVCVLDKKEEFTLDEKIKYFFMFWKSKPNREFKVIKNRYAKNTNTNIKIDFKNLIIKK